MAFVIGKNIQPLIFYKDTDICGVDDRIKIQKVDDRTLNDISKYQPWDILPLSSTVHRPVHLKTISKPSVSISNKSQLCTDMRYRSESIIISAMSEISLTASIDGNYARRWY